MKELWNSVVIRYDELTTKKDNRFAFIAILKENLNKQLSLISPLIQIIAKHDYAYLFFSNSLTSVVINKLTSLLQHTFGISSFSYAKKTSIELAQMEYESELILRRYAHSTDKKFTFKVEVIRSYKKAP
jgi:thiamine biosynthesis protein ThiI